MEWSFAFLAGVGVAVGVVAGCTRKLRENSHNRRLRSELEERAAQLEGRDTAFKNGMCEGRRWLANLIAEAERTHDTRDADLRHKSHPARKSAEIVRDIKREKRELLFRAKFLEYQLKSYEEYFPFLEEYREIILDERIPLAAGADNLSEIETVDPVQTFLSREEWKNRSPTERNQLALDRYLSRTKSNWEIGRYYERYIGYLREKEGWAVEYHGALHGLEDLGRDLICSKGSDVEIIQAKCWSRTKTIHEKHLFQLFGSTIDYRLRNPRSNATPVLVTTTTLSDVAKEVARLLEVTVKNIALPSSYPLIKCNINQSTHEHIYHLPFDQQYDRTQVSRPGEGYAQTVEEAEKLGFRRAWRWQGN